MDDWLWLPGITPCCKIPRDCQRHYHERTTCRLVFLRNGEWSGECRRYVLMVSPEEIKTVDTFTTTWCHHSGMLMRFQSAVGLCGSLDTTATN